MTTKKKYIQHNKQCFACGQEKSPSFLGYDISTLKTYCLNKCKNKKDIPSVELIPATNEELVSAIVGNYSEEDEKTIMNLMGSVASVRLKPAHIMHLMKLAEMEELAAMQATIINAIEADMENRSMDDVKLASFGLERPEEEEDEVTEAVNAVMWKYEEAKAGHAPEEMERIVDLQHFAPPAPEPITVVINDKPVEPVKEEEEDDNPFEI